MDEAAGTHIRFRLASPTRYYYGSTGSKFGSFPPAVYYKIYTHRPVIDLCATAPRDYTKAKNKISLPKQRFNQIKESEDPGTASGWYKRFENNYWRPVSDKVLLTSLGSGYSDTTYAPTVQERRVKKSNAKKYKRIEWLQKMFDGDNLNLGPSNQSTDQHIEEAIEGMYFEVAKYKNQDQNPLIRAQPITNDVDDEDVQALIDWTCGLDFNDYSNYWSHLGTAGFPSIEILGEKKRKFIKTMLESTKSDDENRDTEQIHSEYYENSINNQINKNLYDVKFEQNDNFDDFWTLDELEKPTGASNF